jgi:hypothetical protein
METVCFLLAKMMISCEIKLILGTVEMPISYSLNSQEGYLEIKCEGLISDKEILTERMTYMDRADWIPGTNELVDLSEADFSEVTPDGIQHLSNTIDHIYKAHGLTTIKVAVYTQDLLPSVITSLYSEFAQESVENIRVFNDLAEAKKWLQDDLTGMKYSINIEKNIVYSESRGFVSINKLINHIKEYREDQDFRESMNIVADFRQAILPEDHSQIFNFTRFIAQPGFNTPPLAAIISSS